MRKLFSSMLALFMAFSVAGCSSNTPSETGTFKAGTYSASEQGFGGEVTVTITTDTSKITDVVIVGEKETPEKGGVAMEQMQSAILEKQTSDVDLISGSTITSEAVKKAAEKAIAEAKGEEIAEVSGEVKMQPGEYDAESYGFFMGWSDKVRVTVDESSIVSIEWNPDVTSGDTPPMLDTVEKNLFPRIIENQSVAVDGVTGATATSTAVKSAVKDALKQALVAGGSDEALVSAFEKTTEKESKTETLDTDVLVIVIRIIFL